MQNDNIYKKLRCIFLVLAIISMIIAITKKVNAQDIYYTTWADYVYNDTYSRMNNTSKSSMDNLNYRTLIDYLCEKFPYFLRYSNTNANGVYYIFSTLEEFAVQTMWGSFTDNIVHIRANYSSSSVNTNGYNFSYNNAYPNPVMIDFNGYNWACIMVSIYITDNGYVQFNNFNFNYATTPNTNMNYYENNDLKGTVSRNTTTLNGYGKYLYAFYSNVNDSSEHTFDTFDSNCKCYVTQDYNRGVYNYLDNTLNLKMENTNGFSVFTYNNLGIDTLRIVPPKNKVQVGTHISNISSVTFDLVIDETIIPTTYNSVSDYYYESIEYNRAYYEIPFSTLLPSSINDFSNVYVTNVVYTNEWENQGGETGTDTFYYVDKVYLKQTIENEDIGQVTIAHVDSQTGYDETHITDIYNMITNASTISGEFNTEKNLVGGSSTPYSFTSFQDAIVRTVECYHPTGTKSTDWTPIINENGIEFESGDNMYWLEYVNNTQVFNNRYNYNISPYSYIRENNYTGYYDILYFIVHEQVYSSNETGFSTLDNSYTRYFYFISDRYYNKLILYREMDIMEYIKLNNEISEKIYNYLYDRLLNIDDNLYYYIKDKANIDNDILTALENIDNDMQFNFDVLNDLLNKILNALSDLRLTQLDTIETKLNTIISNIGQSNTENEDDTVAEAIQYYRSHNTNGVPTGQVYIDDKMSIWISGKVHLWLQGTDANTDKTNLINSVFDTLTSIYDSMKNNNDIFPNIQYYLDAIAKNNNYAYETHGDYMTRLFKGNVDISTYSGISE